MTQDLPTGFEEIPVLHGVSSTTGPEYILVNVSVEFADQLNAGEIEQAIAHMDREIKRTLPSVKRVFVEAEAHVHIDTAPHDR